MTFYRTIRLHMEMSPSQPVHVHIAHRHWDVYKHGPAGPASEHPGVRAAWRHTYHAAAAGAGRANVPLENHGSASAWHARRLNEQCHAVRMPMAHIMAASCALTGS